MHARMVCGEFNYSVWFEMFELQFSLIFTMRVVQTAKGQQWSRLGGTEEDMLLSQRKETMRMIGRAEKIWKKGWWIGGRMILSRASTPLVP